MSICTIPCIKSVFTCALLLVPRDHFVILKIAPCIGIIPFTFACKPPLAVWYLSFHRRHKMEDVWKYVWLNMTDRHGFGLVVDKIPHVLVQIRESATNAWFHHDSIFYMILISDIKAEPRQRQIALLQRCLVANSCNSGIGLSGVERT